MQGDTGQEAAGDADADMRLLTDARAAAAGDASALIRLVPTLYDVARRALGARLRDVDPEDLADLTSEGVVKAIEHLHAARPASAAMFRAWVRAVVWRAALDARRTRGRHDAAWRAASLDAHRDGAPHAPATRALPHPTSDPWPGVGDSAPESPLAALARLAVDAQRELPPGASLVLWAHLVTGAGWADVAVLVGTTPAGAKRRFQRAVVALRAAVWRAAPDLPAPMRAAALARLHTLDPRHPGDA